MSGVEGPYVLKARITEYTAVSDYNKEKLNLGLYKDETKQGRGIVALDIEVVHGPTGTVAAAYPARASFGYQDREEGSGGLLPIYKQRQYAQSAIDQALRQATNDAATQLWDKLASQS